MDAPWMQDKEWASGRIRSHAGAATAGLWIMAVLANGLSWTVMILFWRADERDFVKVAALFCALALFLLLAAAWQTWGWLRHGNSILELGAAPGVIGGKLEGVIHTRLSALPGKPIQVTLTCNRQFRSKAVRGSGEADRINTAVLWQADRNVPAARLTQGPDGLSCPFCIQIPYGLPGSEKPRGGDGILWRLGASCDVPGIDFVTEFLVPVFVTEDSNPAWTEEAVATMAEQDEPADSPAAPPPLVGETAFEVQPTRRGGTQYEFRMTLPAGVAVALPVTGALITAGSAALYMWLGEMGPFAVLPATLGVLLLLASAVGSTYRVRVVVDDGFVTIRKSALAIPRTWRIPFSEITGVRMRQEVVEGVKGKRMPWDIEIHRTGHPSVSLGVSIRERGEADRVAEQLRRLTR